MGCQRVLRLVDSRQSTTSRHLTENERFASVELQIQVSSFLVLELPGALTDSADAAVLAVTVSNMNVCNFLRSFHEFSYVLVLESTILATYHI